MPGTPLRIAVDIGGTFTDTVLAGAGGRILASAKTLTTHSNPADGAAAGVKRALAEAGEKIENAGGFIHGATLAANALIEKRGARTAAVTTRGFRDILDIGYERRYDQYDITMQKPDLLVPRERRFTAPERMSVNGEVLAPLDEAEAADMIAGIKACGAEAVAVCLLHAYANPAHENRLREMLQKALPEAEISLSSEISPEAREFDRLCTTVANAYIQPLMTRYLAALEAQFRAEGLICPILMMTAGGGMCTVETAARFPVRLIESGPAGGAVLAARIAAENGLNEVLSFDMGGTTAKLCLIDNAEPQTSRTFEIARAARFIKGSGMPVRIPVIEMIEIGAGGGSVAGVDRLGRLTVGPESAGSEPGPAAFGRGGDRPTVSDADITLGYIRPEAFAEGRIALDPEAAERALKNTVGAALGISAEDAADGVSRIVDEAMAGAARMHAAESGKDLSARTMIAFGGNGPLHACRMARAAGVSRILIPANPGVGSAVGFLHAAVSFETVRSRYALLESLDFADISRLLESMEAEAEAVVRQGAPEGALMRRRSAFMRYSGQGHEIEIDLPEGALAAADAEALTAAFETAYTRRFFRPVPGMKIEILNWAVRVSTPPAPPPAAPPAPEPRAVRADATRTVRCDISGEKCEAAFINRASLAPGGVITGPALIAEPQTVTFVGRDFTACADGAGGLVLTRASAGA